MLCVSTVTSEYLFTCQKLFYDVPSTHLFHTGLLDYKFSDQGILFDFKIYLFRNELLVSISAPKVRGHLNGFLGKLTAATLPRLLRAVSIQQSCRERVVTIRRTTLQYFITS